MYVHHFYIHSRWKDPNNAFRKHPKLLLKGVPTLLQWNTVNNTLYTHKHALSYRLLSYIAQAKKLGEEDCANEELVKMIFEDE